MSNRPRPPLPPPKVKPRPKEADSDAPTAASDPATEDHRVVDAAPPTNVANSEPASSSVAESTDSAPPRPNKPRPSAKPPLKGLAGSSALLKKDPPTSSSEESKEASSRHPPPPKRPPPAAGEQQTDDKALPSSNEGVDGKNERPESPAPPPPPRPHHQLHSHHTSESSVGKQASEVTTDHADDAKPPPVSKKPAIAAKRAPPPRPASKPVSGGSDGTEQDKGPSAAPAKPHKPPPPGRKPSRSAPPPPVARKPGSTANVAETATSTSEAHLSPTTTADGRSHRAKSPPPPKPPAPSGSKSPVPNRPPRPSPSQPDKSASDGPPQRPARPSLSASRPAPPRPSKPTSDRKKPAPASSKGKPSPAGSKPPAPPQATRPSNKPPPLPPRPGPGHPLYHYMVTGPRANVLFDWEGEQDGELSLTLGGIVKLKRWVNPEWLEGEDENGKLGRFPAVFVDVVEDVEIEGPQGLCTTPFTGAYEHELSLCDGDAVKLRAQLDDAWYRVEFHGKEGAVPIENLSIVTDFPGGQAPREDWPQEWLDAYAAPPPDPDVNAEADGEVYIPVAHHDEHEHAAETDTSAEGVASPGSLAGDTPRAFVLYEFHAEDSCELSLVPGTTVELLERMPDGEWLKGRVDGREGIFPANFVEIEVPLPDSAVGSPDHQAGGSHSDTPPVSSAGSDNAASTQQASGSEQTSSAVAADVHEDNHDKADSAASVPATPEVSSLAGTAATTSTSSHGDVVAHAFVLYAFEAVQDGDLALPVAGETVDVLELLDDEWARGRREGQEGIFPLSFVDLTMLQQSSSDSGAADNRAGVSSAPKGTRTGLAHAEHDYHSGHAEDLSFAAGEDIVLLERVGDEWYKGQIGQRTGLFPSTFVTVLEDV